jgi:hypothetical protein
MQFIIMKDLDSTQGEISISEKIEYTRVAEIQFLI